MKIFKYSFNSGRSRLRASVLSTVAQRDLGDIPSLLLIRDITTISSILVYQINFFFDCDEVFVYFQCRDGNMYFCHIFSQKNSVAVVILHAKVPGERGGPAPQGKNTERLWRLEKVPLFTRYPLC